MPAGIEPIEQFTHPGGARTVLRSHRFPYLFALLVELRDHFKHRIQARASSHQHTNTDNAAFMECSQRIQVSVKGLVLRVPL